MSQVNQARLAAGFSKSPLPTVSVEENDVNINITAETEGGESSAPEVVEAEPAVIDTEVDVDAVPLDTSETPEASELEVQEVQDQADETVDDIQELDSSLDSLESIYYTLANISAEGMEITPAVARLTHVAVQNAIGRYGLTPADAGVASIEAIELAPQAEIEVSMEGIAETAKAGAKYIADLMKKLIDQIGDFLKTMLTATGRTEKRISDVESALRSFKGTWNSELTAPAILNGWVKPADLNKAAQAGKDFLSAKYADIAVLAKSDIQDGKKVVEAFTKANMGIAKYGDGEVMPAASLYLYPTVGSAVMSVKGGEAKSVTVSQSEAAGILAAAKDLVAAAKTYNNGKSARKQITDSIRNFEQKNADVAAVAARRKLATAWSRQLNEETRVASRLVTYANAAAALVAQGMKGGKKAEKAAEA